MFPVLAGYSKGWEFAHLAGYSKGWEFAHLLFTLLLKIAQFKERLITIHSRHSLKKSDMSKLLSSFFKKELCE